MTLCIASLVIFLLQFLIVVVNADCSPSTGSVTIKTSQDVSDIAKCSSFTGDINVAADGPEDISLDGIKTVSGSISVANAAKLHSLSSKSLESVKSLTFDNLPELSNMNFPVLRRFDAFKWNNLPALSECKFGQAHDGEIQEITVNNTSLKSLDWLVWPVGGRLAISNNANLKFFEIPYNAINEGSSLILDNNAALEDIDVSQLSGINGPFQVTDNEKVTQLLFDKLETVGGDTQLRGAFTNISMPALTQIRAGLRIQSSNDISEFCSRLQSKSQNLKGYLECNPNVQKSPVTNSDPTKLSNTPTTPTPTSLASSNSPTDNRSNDSGPSNGVKAALVVSALVVSALVATFLILIFAFFYFRRRSRAKVREIPKPKNQTDSIESEDGLPTLKELESGPHIKLELVTRLGAQELPAQVPLEMPAGHGTSELSAPTSPATSFTSARSTTPLVRVELPA
ncbi:hypothetical protein K469DRAFT_622252 [Zopfia rhizophila CBS 207.26]|uniref:GPI-anchored cell wall organization protein Ecm33 n=1 Tax=Zopfia rhizophila CBS 207.26 TaxID=1314779 RepID=A0A6A6EG15_9PEZI|nr:hypothetical protein K469DRAFT_622252 [Zopfia rhizophila CBS 207.26]